MATRAQGKRSEVWIGNDSPAEAEADGWFNGGRTWIGRHSADGDVLVFDPTVCDPAASNLSFFSLTELRQRRFPRAVVEQKIHEVTDAAEHADATERYGQWPALKAAHERERDAARAEVAERQKRGVIELHREFLEERGIAYEGVRETGSGQGASKRRRTKCHSCGIGLDDFAGSECVACGIVLCSCGACGCTRPATD